MAIASGQFRRLSIDVPVELHDLIKKVASFEQKTMRDFVVEAVKEQLKDKVEIQKQAMKSEYRRLNELTRRTLEMADRGEDLHEYENLADFIAEMNKDEPGPA